MRAGKTQAVLEHAIVRADQLLTAGIENPVVVYAFVGRVSELRARLDEMGGGKVLVQPVMKNPNSQPSCATIPTQGRA